MIHLKICGIDGKDEGRFVAAEYGLLIDELIQCVACVQVLQPGFHARNPGSLVCGVGVDFDNLSGQDIAWIHGRIDRQADGWRILILHAGSGCRECAFPFGSQLLAVQIRNGCCQDSRVFLVAD